MLLAATGAVEIELEALARDARGAFPLECSALTSESNLMQSVFAIPLVFVGL